MNPSFEKSHITTVAINATGKVSWDQEDETLYVDFSQKVLNELYNADPSSYQGKLLSFGRVELSSDHLHLNGQSVSVTFTDITKSENYQVAYWYALAESEQFPATKVLIGAKVKKDAEAEDSPSLSLSVASTSNRYCGTDVRATNNPLSLLAVSAIQLDDVHPTAADLFRLHHCLYVLQKLDSFHTYRDWLYGLLCDFSIGD